MAKQLTTKQVEALPWLHLYGQYCWHSEAKIIGTKNGLRALRDAIDGALSGGLGSAKVYANDGEGYTVEVQEFNNADQLGSPQYLMELEPNS